MGILHRDVSTGNILICPEGDDPTVTNGHLIDLDYAKMTSEFIPPIPTVAHDDGMERMYATRSEVLRRKGLAGINIEAFKPIYRLFQGDDMDITEFLLRLLRANKNWKNSGREASLVISSCRQSTYPHH